MMYDCGAALRFTCGGRRRRGGGVMDVASCDRLSDAIDGVLHAGRHLTQMCLRDASSVSQQPPRCVQEPQTGPSHRPIARRFGESRSHRSGQMFWDGSGMLQIQ